MPQVGDRHIDEKTGAIMVYVPPGVFWMGLKTLEWSNEERKGSFWHSDSQPTHQQVISNGFWLDLTPVTNAAYALFVADGGYITRKWWTARGWKHRQKAHLTAPIDLDTGFDAPDQPRVNISWYEAMAFAKWRGCRLPTEAEWEWAARGSHQYIYPWGNVFCSDLDVVIFEGNSNRRTYSVGSEVRLRGAAWCGALDMCGNIRQWTSSAFRPYPYRAKDGRESVAVTGKRVVRGGAGTYPELMRNDYRFPEEPRRNFRSLGFRAALSAKEN